MPSVAAAAAAAVAAAVGVAAAGVGDIGRVGHTHLFLGRAVVVDIHLCHFQVPYHGYPYHCASIATIHDVCDQPAVQEPAQPEKHPTILSVASRRLIFAP